MIANHRLISENFKQCSAIVTMIWLKQPTQLFIDRAIEQNTIQANLCNTNTKGQGEVSVIWRCPYTGL